MNISMKRFGLIVLLVYYFFAMCFYFLAGESFHNGVKTTPMLDPVNVTGELLKGESVAQNFLAPYNTINKIYIKGATYNKNIDNILNVKVYNENGDVLINQNISTEAFNDNGNWLIPLKRPILGYQGKILKLEITSINGVSGHAIAFYYGNKVKTVRADVPVTIPENERIQLSYNNGQLINGRLCLAVNGVVHYTLSDYYWHVVIVLSLFMIAYFIYAVYKEKKGKLSFFSKLIRVSQKYSFLLQQLVQRDFKTKYKRSILGMFWSFLNPLLFMIVQYVVFSTLFETSIENFVVYLLIGIVCWNFFNEVTSMCLTSITGNASLITKVYMPKYIYPFSRSLSSCVNFILSLVPLFLVSFIVQTPITKAWFLIAVPVFCLFMFSLGMGMILASLMVFFRDIEFLWSVTSTMWMYLTPIFYPESIIPSNLMFFYKLNPLYHVLQIFRTLMISGISPEPSSYIQCFFFSLVPFVIGIIVFKKTQDKFVLYL